MKQLILLLALGLSLMAAPAFAEDGTESAYERVMRTQTIRCGYVVYPPAVIQDPNTGALSGIIYDVMQEAGNLLGLEIEWAEEVGWANTVETIRTWRTDAICVGFWQNPAEGKYLGFTTPLWYSAVNAFVRADDNRFDGDIALINSEDVTISAGDGEMAAIIAKQDFPKAKILSKPNMTSVMEQLMDVKTGKADLTFVENYLGNQFMDAHPQTLKNITKARPLRVFGNTIALPQEDVRLQSMLNSALVQILNSGQMEKILHKYEKYPGSLYPVLQPYKVPE